MDTLFNVAMYCYIDTMVSDIVWAQLDPHAGRLTRAERARLLVAVAGGVALLVAFALASTAGLVTPRVSATQLPGRGTEGAGSAAAGRRWPWPGHTALRHHIVYEGPTQRIPDSPPSQTLLGKRERHGD